MTHSPRIAVIGPGAIGGIVAALLAEEGRDVAVCARTGFDRLIVETPDGTVEARPRLLLDPADAEQVDWVLVATKTYDVAGTAVWLERLIGPETRVAILQNGVEHVARFAALVPAERIVPVVVDIPAERSAPGRIVQRRRGSLLVPAGANGAAFVALFAGAGVDAAETPDFATAAWRKLCINCAGAVSALALAPQSVAWIEPAAEVMRALVRECVLVGRAEGALLPDTLADEVVEGTRASPPDSVNSMLADRRAGRPMEVDARNAIIGRIGRRHGIATPVSDTVTALLLAIGELAER